MNLWRDSLFWTHSIMLQICHVNYWYRYMYCPFIPFVRDKWSTHDDVITLKHFPCYLSFMRGIHRSPLNSTHKDQWRGALPFSLICAWINGWVNNRESGDLRRHLAHYDATVMKTHDWMSALSETRLCCQTCGTKVTVVNVVGDV